LSFNAGAITGSIGLDTAPLDRSTRHARGLVSGLQRSTAGMFAGIAGGLTAALGGIGAGAAVKLSAEFEQAQVSFETMLGSAEQAKGVMAEIEQFAASTPFQFPDLAAAGRSLLAFGTAAEDLIPEMRVLGDLSAGLNIPIKDLADLYGKARVQGRIMMEDINQLTGRGIPIIAELAKQFGVAESKVRDLVSSGKVNFSNLQKAFRALTAEGSKFGGGMAAQSKTLAGVWSTLKDNVTAALRQVGDEVVVNLDIKNAISSTTTALQAAIPRIAATTASTLNWISTNKELIVGIGLSTAAVSALAKALPAAIALTNGLTASQLANKAAAIAMSTATLTLATAGIGALVAGLGIATAAFIRSRTQSISFGDAILDLAADMGIFESEATALRRMTDQLDQARASSIELQNTFNNTPDIAQSIPIQQQYIDSLERRLSLQRRIAQVEGRALPAAVTDMLQREIARARGDLEFMTAALSNAANAGVPSGPISLGDDILTDLQTQLDALDLTDVEQKFAEIRAKGLLNEDELIEARRLLEAISDQTQVQGLLESIQSPLDAFQERMEELSGFLARGLIDQQQFDKLAGNARRDAFGEQKLAGLNFAGSNEELQLQARQRLAASGAPGGGGDDKKYEKQQVDEQKQTNKRLDAVASLLRQMLGNDPTVSIPGL